MIKRWVKLLPYWVVVWCLRYIGASFGTFNSGREYKVRFFQIDKGEFVVFSEEVFEGFQARMRAKNNNKVEKKLEKINNILSGDFELRKALEKQIQAEINMTNEDDE